MCEIFSKGFNHFKDLLCVEHNIRNDFSVQFQIALAGTYIRIKKKKLQKSLMVTSTWDDNASKSILQNI